MNTMLEQIKDLSISNKTARLIACLRMMQEIYGEVDEVMSQIYGEGAANSIIDEKLGDGYRTLEKGLQECLMLSICENLNYRILKSI